MAAAERGVVYLVWGDRSTAVLDRSIKSLVAVHSELSVEVFRVDVDDPIKGLLEKPRMFELSPFRETLFLDADTVVLGRLDYGFEQARRFGLACCICECPWARRYGSLAGDLIEYNTGVLFFSEKARPVFEAWRRMSIELDSSIRFMQGDQVVRMPYNDQCGFAAAVASTEFSPFVLPLNWNFRPQWQTSFFGPIKIWHDYSDPPSSLGELHAYYENRDAIIQYHAT